MPLTPMRIPLDDLWNDVTNNPPKEYQQWALHMFLFYTGVIYSRGILKNFPEIPQVHEDQI